MYLPNSTVRSGAIATPHHLATEEGRHVLARGGSAVDAAITAAAVLSVVYPHNVSIGGDLIALTRGRGGRVDVLNSSGPAPAGQSLDRLVARHGRQLPTRGLDTVTVPGAVAGWQLLHRDHGVLPWAELLAPAVGYARDGAPVAPSLARALARDAEELRGDRGFAEVFLPGGAPLPEGALLRQPALAETLGLVQEHGAQALYLGAVGRRLVDGVRELGGILSTGDLRAFIPETTEPLAARVGSRTYLTSRPNTSGFILLRVLGALDRAGALTTALTDDLELTARLFHYANKLRDTRIADPRYAAVDIDALLNGDLDEVTGPRAPVPDYRRPYGDTVGVAAIDEHGGAVSLIQSVYHGFGSGILEPSTGILLQNRGTSFSLDPASPNAVAPGKRPMHTLMPVLVAEDDAVRYVSSTMGGQGQPQIHAQVLLRTLAGADAQEAVGAPRIMVGEQEEGDTPDTVYVEPGADPSGVLAATTLASRILEHPSEILGHANLIGIDLEGVVEAAADPRSDGAAVAV
jgi:gamma-glutamyltranspeptidase